MSTRVKIGLGLSALLGLVDVISLFLPNGPEPMVVVVATAIVGLATLVGVGYGWRGRPAGLITAIVTRVLSAISALPAFVADIPTPEKVSVVVFLLVTATAIFLVSGGLRSPARVTT